MIHQFFSMIGTGTLVLMTLFFMLFTILILGAAAKVTLDILDWLFS